MQTPRVWGDFLSSNNCGLFCSLQSLWPIYGPGEVASNTTPGAMDPESPRMGCAISTALSCESHSPSSGSEPKPLRSYCLSHLLTEAGSKGEAVFSCPCRPQHTGHLQANVLPAVGSDHERVIKRYSNRRATCQRKPWSGIHTGRFSEGRAFFLIHSFIHFILSLLHRSNI